MSTVLQRTYGPQQRAAVVGMIADMVEHTITTKVCETAAGIGFGLAVGQGTGDKGCVIGGASFLGIAVRDITLSLSPVDPLSDTANTLDKYGQYTNVGVLSRGHIWVAAGGNVAAGAAVYYNETTGVLGGSASGNSATGWVTFSKQPVADETLVINGATLTFKASGASGDQANIGATLGDTVVNTVKVLNDSSTGGFAALTFSAFPASPGGSGQGSGADTIYISDNTVGANTKAITTIPAGATKSAATLTGGTAAGTVITGARWLDSSIAGLPARIALAMQI